jgi:aldose 1-epimerase
MSWEDEAKKDIVLGYKNASTMMKTGNPVYFSSVVGRVANRIAKGRLAFFGESFDLEVNDPPNHLHGGGSTGGFSHKNWDAEIIDFCGGKAVCFSLLSPDGDQGYPGSVQVTATYSLRPSLTLSGVVLRLDISAKLIGDKPTPINLAQHSYFNLSGQDSPNGILDHSLKIESDAYTPVDETAIPTREVRSLDEDSIMDWRTERQLRGALQAYGVEKMGFSPERTKEDLNQRKQNNGPYGFDHNYVVRKQPGTSIPQVASLTYNTRRMIVCK